MSGYISSCAELPAFILNVSCIFSPLFYLGLAYETFQTPFIMNLYLSALFSFLILYPIRLLFPFVRKKWLASIIVISLAISIGVIPVVVSLEIAGFRDFYLIFWWIVASIIGCIISIISGYFFLYFVFEKFSHPQGIWGSIKKNISDVIVSFVIFLPFILAILFPVILAFGPDVAYGLNAFSYEFLEYLWELILSGGGGAAFASFSYLTLRISEEEVKSINESAGYLIALCVLGIMLILRAYDLISLGF